MEMGVLYGPRGFCFGPDLVDGNETTHLPILAVKKKRDGMGFLEVPLAH
jgi:hypothetical protein